MKALDEYVLMVMFELVLKRVHFLVILFGQINSSKKFNTHRQWKYKH